jgi:hypothetical protein
MILGANGDYFLEQYEPAVISNGEVLCSLWRTDLILKYYLD